MFYKLQYVTKSETGICGSDFDDNRKEDNINTSLILSISSLMEFKLPFSGRFICNYALVTMSNNDKYYIDEEEFIRIYDLLQLHKLI